METNLNIVFDPSEVEHAVEVMRKSGIILYPTDTIWGLGCDATNEKAVLKIATLKRRQKEKSFVILMSSLKQLAQYVETIPENLETFMQKYSEPVTFIVEGGRGLAKQVISREGTIAIRIPKDAFCLQLIDLLGVPILSTSANYSGVAAPVIFSEIDPAIISGVDYPVQYRRWDTHRSRPSRIVYINPLGDTQIIRE